MATILPNRSTQTEHHLDLRRLDEATLDQVTPILRDPGFEGTARLKPHMPTIYFVAVSYVLLLPFGLYAWFKGGIWWVVGVIAAYLAGLVLGGIRLAPKPRRTRERGL